MNKVFERTGDRGWYWAGAGFCALMLTVHVLAGLNCAGLVDFWRDMYWATVIANGERFPLSGPPINRLVEVGPWWFYLLAVPIWLTHRIAVASAFIQLLAGMKYVLAWRIGTRAVDARFGLAFAVGTAVAGWSTAGFWFPSHPALVETTVLLLAMSVWRCWNRLSVGNAALFGLAAAVCLHAHPTTTLYVLGGGFAVLYRHRSWRAVGMLALSAAIVLVSLLPPWFDATPVVEEGRRTVDDYTQQDFNVNLFTRIPLLLKGLVVGGAWSGFLLMTPWKMATAKLAWWVYCGCLVVAGTGVLLLQPHRRNLRAWFIVSLGFLVVQVAFLALIRVYSPIWMAAACLPPLSLCIAIGWYGWFDLKTSSARIAGIAAFVVYAALILAPFGLFLRTIHNARVMPHANPLSNISETEDDFKTIPVPFVSVSRLDRIARELCEPMTLHLRLGAAMENAFAVPMRNACGKWPPVHFSGTQTGEPHLAGIPNDAVDAIEIAPDRVSAGLALYSNVRAIAPEKGNEPTPLQRMQVRPLVHSKGPEPLTFDFETAAGDVAAITNRFGNVGPLSMQSVLANGEAAKLLYTDGRAFVYGCSACAVGSPVHWHMQVDGIEHNLDLIVLQKAR